MNADYEISPAEFELIEKYLRNEASPDELTAFTEKSKTDNEWMKKAEEVNLLLTGIQESALSKRFAGFHDELTDEKKSSGKSGRLFRLDTRWLVAASVVIIAVVAGWLLLSGPGKFEKMYSRYYQPDPGLLTAMGSPDNYSFEKGMVAYKNEEYNKAIQSWSPLLTQDPNNDTLHYFLGAANQALGNDDAAKKHFSVIVKDNSHSFYSDACWYLGMLFLKQGDIQATKTFIEKSAHPGKEELLNAINQHE